MKIVGLLFTILGFVHLIIMSIREKNKKTHWKIMVGASCGAFVMGGLIILMMAMI